MLRWRLYDCWFTNERTTYNTIANRQRTTTTAKVSHIFLIKTNIPMSISKHYSQKKLFRTHTRFSLILHSAISFRVKLIFHLNIFSLYFVRVVGKALCNSNKLIENIFQWINEHSTLVSLLNKCFYNFISVFPDIALYYLVMQVSLP